MIKDTICFVSFLYTHEESQVSSFSLELDSDYVTL